MSVQQITHCALALSLCVFVAGCSSPGPRRGGQSYQGSATNPCRLDPSSCAYDGQYEPDEKAYAEREARRLNQAEVRRLRHNGY